jgi:cellulose synthase/poly-beta-1,6-N-acetylglucosamine synthase-like glycosyltransferase
MGPELITLSMLFGALGVHPFTTYPASLALLARLVRRPVQRAVPAPKLRVALCVCAYNEEPVIRAKAENMLRMREAIPDLQLLVYVDAAADRTADILGEYARDITLFVSPTRHGKTHGMNTLVAATEADILVFSDANVLFAPDAISRLLERFGDPEIGCVCGHLIYTRAAGSVTAATGSIYWRLEEMIKELESRTGSTMGADGSIFAIRRALHTSPPPDIIDDMFVSLSILCDGYRVVRASDAVAYEETVSRPGEEFRRKVRIACQAFNVHRLLAPRLRSLRPLDRYKYLSHKLLRWISGYMFGASALTLLLGLAALGAWKLLLGTIMFGLAATVFGLARPASLAGKIIDIAFAFVATGLGVLRSFRGDRFQTWTPPASARQGGIDPESRTNSRGSCWTVLRPPAQWR